MEFSAEQIASLLGGEIVGDPQAKVHTVSSIEEARQGAMAYLSNPKYESYIYTTGASIVLVPSAFASEKPVAATLIKLPDVGAAVVKLLEMYQAAKPRKTGISAQASISEKATVGEGVYVGAFAVVEDGAKIGKNCRIYPQVYVGDGVTIGDDTTLYPGVKIYEGCVVGSRCNIHAGAVIGADGFGFALKEDGSFDKIPQLGNVIIEDDVEIGANTCIDRAKTDSTIIRRGVKLDNLIQIAHNVQIGENTVASAQLGVAGSTKVGRNCFFGGQVGIVDHITVGDRVMASSKTGLDNNVGDDEKRSGWPSMPSGKYRRSNAVFRNLPELANDVYRLQKEVAELKKEK